MSDKPQVPADETPPEEYAKPNPQDNPRNISLGEIAKAAAERHKADAAETAPTIDDEGNITPAAPPAEPPADQPAVEAAAPPAPAEGGPPPVVPPSELAPAAPEAPPAIDPSAEYEVTVEGRKIKVPGKALWEAGVRTFQKESAADFRLQMASELLKEAEAKVRAATPQGPPAAPQPPAPAEKSDAELANALQFGTPEQAAEALATLRGKGAVTPEQVQQFASQQARFAAQDEVQFQNAMTFVKAEYNDLLSNDYLRRLFFVEENRRRAPKERGGEGDRRPYKELYESIGSDLRKAFNLSKPASPSAPTPPGTVAARQERKAAAAPVPRTAATRLQEAAAAEKVKTPSEIIASMAEKRGQARLTPVRKGA